MIRILIQNARIYTMAGITYPCGWSLIKGEKIAKVSKFYRREGKTATVFLSTAKGAWVLRLIDAHSIWHSEEKIGKGGENSIRITEPSLLS